MIPQLPFVTLKLAWQASKLRQHHLKMSKDAGNLAMQIQKLMYGMYGYEDINIRVFVSEIL